MFLRNCWYMAEWSAELDKIPITPVRLLDEALVFYRKTDRSLVAMDDRCSHKLAPLSLGQVEGDDLRCMYHGLKFGADGQCNEIPQQDKRISKALCVRTYPVIERYNAAWVWMGDPELADPDKIPPFAGPPEYKWSMIPDKMELNANYQLINDNLLDLSHVAFVHKDSFGASDDDLNKSFAKVTVETTKLDNGLRVERWMPNSSIPPYVKDDVDVHDADFYTWYDFLVPGVFLLNTRCYPIGTFERYGKDLSNVEPIFSEFSSQAITPVTEDKSRYFFALGPWEQHGHLDKFYLEMGFRAFGEDKVMIEAQQQVIKESESTDMINLIMDQSAVSFRAMMTSLIKEEEKDN